MRLLVGRRRGMEQPPHPSAGDHQRGTVQCREQSIQVTGAKSETNQPKSKLKIPQVGGATCSLIRTQGPRGLMKGPPGASGWSLGEQAPLWEHEPQASAAPVSGLGGGAASVTVSESPRQKPAETPATCLPRGGST